MVSYTTLSCFKYLLNQHPQEPYFDPLSQQWVTPGGFNQQNGLFTMLMMQLIRQKDPAVDQMLNMGKLRGWTWSNSIISNGNYRLDSTSVHCPGPSLTYLIHIISNLVRRNNHTRQCIKWKHRWDSLVFISALVLFHFEIKSIIFS